MKKSLESILTRIISIFLKFILLTFLTRELSLSDFGYYQLISYFIMISVYIYGVEYYMYGNREVAKSSNYKDKLQEHISFFLTFSPVSIVVQLILIVYLLPNEIINITTIGVLLFVNFCDYFNQEVYRYLVILKKN